MKATYRKLLTLAAALLTAAGFIACQDDQSQEWNDPRLFLPTDLVNFKQDNGLVVRWGISYGAAGYRVDLSEDAEFAEIAATQDIPASDGKNYEAVFTGLEEETLYYIRLYALADNEALNSKYLYSEGTTGLMRSVFNEVGYADMTYTSAALSWTEDLGAREILLTATGEADIHRVLSDEEIREMQAVVTDLKAGVKYKASFYINGELASYVWFTMPQLPEGAILVTNEDDLKTVIEEAPEGAIVLLTAGQTYDYSSETIDLTKAVTVKAAPGGAKPRLYLKSFILGGTTETSSSMPLVRIEGLEVSGLIPSGGQEDLSVQPNDAMFSFDVKNTARDIAVGRLEIADCIIRNYAKGCLASIDYGFHADARIRFDTILADNLLVYDLGRDVDNVNSFLHLCGRTDANDIYCANFIIRNSTFHHLYHGLIEARCWTGIKDQVAAPTAEVTNCTFDYMGLMADGVWTGTKKGGQRYLFEFLGYADKAEITLSHTIVGEVRTNNSNIRPTAFNNATLTCTATFKSTDTAFDSKFTATATNLSSGQTFPKRAEYDFTPTTDYANFFGNGDPRWQ